MSTTGDDPWQKGHYNHQAMWAFYSITNYSGAFMCSILIWAILRERARKRTAGDVFIIGLCVGVFKMAIPCATQCLVNWVSGTNRFQRGWIACELEAFFHVSAIMEQFFSIALIAIRHYYAVVVQARRDIPTQIAWIILCFIWTVGSAITYGFASISEVVLMPAGAYCFYDFSSPLIWWFSLTMVSALGVVIFCYWKIFQVARQTNAAVQDVAYATGPSIHAISVARRSAIFVLIYFIGWFPAVIACVYSLSAGHVIEELDVSLAVCGSLHSDMVPIVYALFNPRFRDWLAKFECIRRRFFKNRKIRITKSHRKTVLSKWSTPSEKKAIPMTIEITSPTLISTTFSSQSPRTKQKQKYTRESQVAVEVVDLPGSTIVH